MAYSDTNITDEEARLVAYLESGAQKRVTIGDMTFDRETARDRLEALRAMRRQRAADQIADKSHWPFRVFRARPERS